MTGPKEAFYDEHIAPLMDKIIERCKTGRIPMLATFELDGDEDDGPLFCTTCLWSPDAFDSTEDFATLRRALTALRRPHQAFAITITTADRPGEGEA